MAIIKEIQTKTGVVATYWNVGEITLYWKEKKAEFKLNGYTDASTKTFEPLEQKRFVFTDLATFPFVAGIDPRVTAYEQVKLTDDFSDAIDA